MLLLTCPSPLLFSSFSYSLKDQFSTDLASPLASTISASPGPGTWTVVNTGTSKFSVSSGVLVINGTFASGDRLTSASFARVVGRAVLWRNPALTTTNTAFRQGWFTSAASTTPEIGVQYNSTPADITIRTGGASIYAYTLGSSEHQYAAVMRSTGGFVLARNGTSGNYKLLWVANTGTAALFAKPVVMSGTNSTNITVDDMRVTDLGGQWASDYGIATNQLTSPAAGTQTTSTADALVEWTFTFDGATQRRVRSRYVDAENHWIIDADPDGSLKLYSKVTSTTTLRASAVAGTLLSTVTYRVVLIQEGNTYRLFVNDVLKFTYTDPSSFFTTATGVVATNAVDSLICWPRSIDLQGA